MVKKIRGLHLMVIGLLSCFGSEGIAGVKGGVLVIKDVKPYVYDEMIFDEQYWMQSGVVNRIRPAEGKRFLVLKVEVGVDWSKHPEATEHRVNLWKEVYLATGKRDKLSAIGMYLTGGRYRTRLPVNLLHKDKESYYVDLVFVVSNTSRKGKLNIQTAEHDVEIGPDCGTVPQHKDPEFEITGAELLDRIASGDVPGRKGDFVGEITPRAGKILRVSMRVTPRDSNRDSSQGFYTRDRFNLLAPDLGVDWGEGLNVKAFAGEFMGKAKYGVARSRTFRDNKWEAIEFTAYFQVPSTLKAFDLTYRERPLAGGVVSSE